MTHDKEFELKAYEQVLKQLENPKDNNLFICSKLEHPLRDAGYSLNDIFYRKSTFFPLFMQFKPDITLGGLDPWWGPDDRKSRIEYMLKLIRSLKSEGEL